MPLLSIEELTSGARLGIWKMDETPEELLSADASLSEVYASTKSLQSYKRRLEKLSVHALLYEMTGLRGSVISHDALSRPFISGYNISISHTRGYAAVIISRAMNVGIDIEYISERVNRVVSKFMRDDEMTPDTTSRLINWSAKETIYKLFSEEDLQYFDMRLQPFGVENEGFVIVEDLKIPKRQKVNYRVSDDYVLTYAVRQAGL